MIYADSELDNSRENVPSRHEQAIRRPRGKPTVTLAGAPAKDCRVVVCGAADIFQAGVTAVLNEASNISVVGQEEADGCTPERLALLRPHVLLVDLDAQLGADRAIRQPIAPIGNTPQTLALTSSTNLEPVLDALWHGVNGLLSKQTPTAELVSAVHTVWRGGAVIDPNMTRQLIDQFNAGQLVPRPRRGHARITMRQQQVLALVGQGLDNTEIADRTGLSKHTVKSHISALLLALALRDRTQLAIFACQHRVL